MPGLSGRKYKAGVLPTAKVNDESEGGADRMGVGVGMTIKPYIDCHAVAGS
jgi:hypothetical protein